MKSENKTNMRISHTPKFVSSEKLLEDEGLVLYRKYRKGELQPVRFRRQHLNDALMGGAIVGDIIALAAMSGGGKTHEYELIKEDFFNKTLNPLCDDYHLLESNFEMSMLKMLIRSIKRKTGLSGAEILSPSNSNVGVVDDAVISSKKELSHHQIDILRAAVNPDEWAVAVREAYARLKLHEKKCVMVSIDHLALLKTMGTMTATIERMMHVINALKLEFKNLFFFILSQTNRDLPKRKDVRDLAPEETDIFQSSAIIQYADVLYVKQRPEKKGHDLYMVVVNPNGNNITRPPRYAALVEHMKPSTNNTTSFLTENRIIFHYLKRRDENEGDSDIYIDYVNPDLDMSHEQEAKMIPAQPRIQGL